MQQPVWMRDRVAPYKALVSPFVPPLLVTASAALILTGCSASGDITARVAPAPRSGSATAGGEPGAALAGSDAPAASNVAVSPRQRGYLDALYAAGVHRSTDLMALSIGSYVCQGRAAGQSDQAVWDFVFPLVRGDISDLASATAAAGAKSPPKPAMSVEDATGAYIRLATDRLC